MPQDAEVKAIAESLVLEAGRAILRVQQEAVEVVLKADSSPVTAADQAAETIILDGLRRAFPGIPCVAEEEIAAGHVPASLGDAFFLVDPLDGTKEFVNRRPDFTVNIALVRNGVPVVGVVYAPAGGRLFSAGAGVAESLSVAPDVTIADRRVIRVRPAAHPPVIVASRSHRTPETDTFIARFPGADLVSVGSSLKFCLLAAGEADLYPRFGRTMEWDTAAGDAVLRAAGGATVTADGRPLPYGKRAQSHDVDFANPFFIAAGDGSLVAS